jgi:hypothetical protein
MPRFFLTGDGHRHPPFGWTSACKGLRAHFERLMASQMLCAHVEEHQEEVKDTSVPTWFPLLYDQGRIFGWELAIYRDLRPVMEKCTDLMAAVGTGLDLSASVIRDIVALDRKMSRVQGNGLSCPSLELDGPPSASVFRKSSNNRVCDGIDKSIKNCQWLARTGS